jgi:hypothetical protein
MDGGHVNQRWLLTTVAPSPRTALSAKSGTGSHEGRPKTFPSCSHNSDNRTGFGAVPLITPNADIVQGNAVSSPINQDWSH